MSTQVMGVLNVTPDSFSDGGDYLAPDDALARARVLLAQGAHIIDVGGESTRPGAERISPQEEQRRVLPVIEALVREGVTVSIDTVNASTARLAVAVGAAIINDVSGGTADPHMRQTVADTGVSFIVMHWRGVPDPSHARSNYADVVGEVADELLALVRAALAEGVSAEQIILDPGLGFDKTAEQGWQLLAGLDRLHALGYPVLIGVSRKRMLAETLAAARGAGTGGGGAGEAGSGSGGDVSADAGDGAIARETGFTGRDLATAAVSALCAREGVWGVRVHDVASTAAAIAVGEAWAAAERTAAPPIFDSSNGLAAQAPIGSAAAPIPQADQTQPCFASLASIVRPAAPSSSAAAPFTGDRIALTGLEVFAHHGVFEFERERGQRFLIDVEVTLDLRSAAEGDDLARTVHYGELAEALLEAAERDPVDLIETLAERLARVALGFDGVQRARLTVHKPDAPIEAQFSDVSVTVERVRPPWRDADHQIEQEDAGGPR